MGCGSRRSSVCHAKACIHLLRLIVLLALSLSTSAAFSDDPINILVIHSYSEFLPWNQSFTKGMQQWLDDNATQATATNKIQPFVFREYLFAHTLSPVPDQTILVNYYRAQFSKTPIYAIVGESEEAAELVYQYGQEIAPDAIQVLHTGKTYPLSTRQVNLTNDMPTVAKHTAELAVRQNPNATGCFIIDGNNPLSSVLTIAYQEALSQIKSCKIEILADFSLTALEEKIASLPKNSIIFYTLVFSDKTGETFTPRAVLGRLATKARAPIYANYSTLMGNGAVGGYVVDSETLARNTFQAIEDFRHEGKFSSKGYSNVIPMFDWNALQAHEIDDRSLPEGSRLINQPATFIERHRNAIIAGLAFLVATLMLMSVRLGYLSSMMKKLREINEKLLEKELELQNINSVLNDMAMRDPLTHLHNRRAMIPLIDEAFRRSNRYGTAACLILCDIDHFKRINDRHGHQTGDAALIFVAQQLINTVRASDSVARWGGEEFLILLPETTLENGTLLAEKIRAHIAAGRFLQGEHHITVSASVVALGAGMSFNACFDALDAALYDAKAAGRNRVNVARNAAA